MGNKRGLDTRAGRTGESDKRSGHSSARDGSSGRPVVERGEDAADGGASEPVHEQLEK